MSVSHEKITRVVLHFIQVGLVYLAVVFAHAAQLIGADVCSSCITVSLYNQSASVRTSAR